MPAAQFLLICYDTPSDRRRRKMVKVLEGFGEGLQYSVFECRLKPSEIELLRKKLKRQVGRDDSLRIYFISADDVTRIEVYGHGDVQRDKVFFLH